jgi:hypothetical protein
MNMVQEEGDSNSKLQELFPDENAGADTRDAEEGAW